MPLITRRGFPPGGWLYFQPQTAWPKDASVLAGKTFDQVVDAILAHRRANPRHMLSLDRGAVEAELDEFTCLRLQFDPNYCTGGPAPKAVRPLRVGQAAGKAFGELGRSVGAVVSKARKYVSGVGVLIDWLGSGAKTVPKDVAEGRAAVCSVCPKNEIGDWESYFTAAAAEKIRSHLALRDEMELRTSKDESLKVCSACLCQLKCKVWVPIEHVEKKLTESMRAELHPSCWILKEIKR